MLWAWEVVGRQSLVETWCMRMGNGESSASGVKESALNVWHAILLQPLPSGPGGTEMWSFCPSLCPLFIYFLGIFFNIFLKHLLCGDWCSSASVCCHSSFLLVPDAPSASVTQLSPSHLGKTEVEKWERAEIAVASSGTTLHRLRLICTFGLDSPSWAGIKPQVDVPFTQLRGFSYVSLCTVLLSRVLRIALWPGSAFSGLGYCRYLYPTHLYLTTHPLTYECPHFTRRCSPPPTNPMSVLLLLAFVFTCILLIPFPNPGLGNRAAEKPDPPPGFSSSSCHRAASLPDYNPFFSAFGHGKNKWKLGLKAFKCL